MRSSENLPVSDGEPVVEPTEKPKRPRPRWIKPVRLGGILFFIALVVEYLGVPELVGASKDFYLLGRINAGWVVGGVVLEAVSLFCYAVLTKILLPHGSFKPTLSRLFRI